MSRRNLKRSNIRKQQSEKDKLKYIDQTSSQYGNLIGLQHLLGTIQKQDIQYHQYMKIPLELIDLTAAFIASLISGNDYYLLGIPSTLSTSSFGFLDQTFEAYQSNVNFIRKTLSKAQISYSSLIVCLWYIDQFFNNHRHHHHHHYHHQRKQQQRRRRQQQQQQDHHDKEEKSSYESSSSSSTNTCHCCSWGVRDIFMASIIVADKYMADITWSNADWAECTNYYYTNQDINRLERLFLKEMNYQLFISLEENYYPFCHYLEFRLHSRQMAIYNNMIHQHHEMIMSYHTINILSQHLPPIYQEKLGLTLRPLDAMLLLTKITTQICFMYLTTVVATLSTVYLCYQYSHTILQFILNDLMNPHMLCIFMNQLDLSQPSYLLLKYDHQKV
ncbi:unnamed protein product [Cunninghamella blakesleeana]